VASVGLELLAAAGSPVSTTKTLGDPELTESADRTRNIVAGDSE